MPKTKISEYSTTNSSNTDIEGINIDEGCAPSGINNAIRELMVHLKEFQTGASGDGFTFAGGVLISGTANTITGNVVMSGTNTLSGATSAAFAAGTVSAPSIYASGDTNTGVFFPAADTIAITEGGVEVVRVNSSSNVGIGTDSPGSKLDVKGTLRLSGSSSGYVGIAPAAAAGSTTYTLPSADGTNGQVLSTNGSGTLSWATASGGSSLDGDTDSATPFETSLGNGAGAVNTGVNNTFIGFEAGKDNTTGTNNTAVGYQALDVNTIGVGNTAVGASALGANTTASSNTAIGYQALAANTTGADNVAVGKNAGATGTNDITTGSQNTLLGYYAQAYSGTANYQIVIGSECVGQNGAGYVTIGDYAGKIYAYYRSSATWTQTSDASMKNVIGPDTLGLSFINRLNPIKFTWKDVNKLPLDHPRYDVRGGLDTTQVIHGFVAQEVKAALDAEGCTTFNGWDQGPDGIQAISREMFISPLVKAVQELSAQVESLKAEIAILKGN